MMRLVSCRSAILVTASLLFASLLIAQQSPTDRWKEDLARFDKEDAEHLPVEGGIVFVGVRAFDYGIWRSRFRACPCSIEDLVVPRRVMPSPWPSES